MSYDNENNLNEQTYDKKKHIKPMLIIISIAVLCVFLIVIISKNTCLFSHNWQYTFCEDPKTCIRCGKTEGKPLGHNVTEWKTEKKQPVQTMSLS